MTYFKNLLFQTLGILFFASSCTNRIQHSVDEEIYVPIEQTPNLSDFVESIEYVALPAEMFSGFFNNVLVTDDHFIFADYDQEMKIYVLDKSFRLVAKIHNYGEGPGEYQWIEAVNFNPDRQTIEVLTNKDLIRFTLEGKSIETVKLPFIFGNLQSISADDYLVYSPDIKKGMLEDDFSNDLFLIKWNSLTGNIEPVIYDFKEDVIGSTVDRNNMYRFEGDVYATYVYLDTVFKVSAKGNITKMYINLSDQNLPLELIYGIQPSEILNREEIKQKYAIHFPGLMVNENFFIDRFAKRNRMNFIIQNKRTSTIISGGKVVNDIDGGIDFLMPRFLDEDDNLYTFHEYEEIWAMAQNFEDNTSEFHTFVNSLSPETGFVVVKYHLKNF